MSKSEPAFRTRREFLRDAGLTTVALGATGTVRSASADGVREKDLNHDRPKTDNEAASEREQAIGYPRIFTDAYLSRISFPLGGIGTGGIGLGGRGNLMDWEIFHRPEVGNCPQYALPMIWAKVGQNDPISKVLERRLLPPFDLKPDNLGGANAPGLPRFDGATFRGSFPTATIDFRDTRIPVGVSLDAFSSFQPVDAELSGLPFANLTYTVQNPTRETAEVVIAWSIENPFGTGDGRTNQVREDVGVRGLLMFDPSLPGADPLQGSFFLAAVEAKDTHQIQIRPYWQDNRWNMGAQRFWFDSFSKTGDLGNPVEPHSHIGSVSIRKQIPPGESRTYRFLIAWHLPNRTPARCGWDAPKELENALLGNYYCTRFADAWSVAKYVTKNLAEIESDTKSFVHSLQSSTLPPVVVEAATANLPTLVSNTSFRIADGSFHGFEGCGDGKGWGFGTCTHVWNYEVATQFLFPSLARSMRSTSFGYATDSEGRMDFRHKLPLGKEHWGAAAADGQMGQIVKLYLDWKLSGDNAWLSELWPACKRALSFAWRPGSWDGNKDGVMEGVQHNTYDIEFYGPNPLCETWYLAALKACAEMATGMNDTAFGATCLQLFEQGRRWTDANLFNGQYYIQTVHGLASKEIATDLRMGMGAEDTEHPDFQAGTGCLVDQLLGQYMADLAGLGMLLDETHVTKAVSAIYKRNYRRAMSDAPSVERAFAVNEERALIMCDFQKDERPSIPFPYYSENFTGSEYASAILMLRYGLFEQGVECIANIRARYDGAKANPYSEAEYGRHYARAMSSWGGIPMISGFRYNGSLRELELKPIISRAKFNCFWSTPTAWGDFYINERQSDGFLRLEVKRGTLDLKQVRLRRSSLPTGKTHAKLGNRSIDCLSEEREGDAVISFPKGIRVTETDFLVLSVVL
jgi:non-lysosomal glucosylceramidase